MLVTKISSRIFKLIAAHNTYAFATSTQSTVPPSSATIANASATASSTVPSLSSLFLASGQLKPTPPHQSLTTFYSDLAKKSSSAPNPYSKMGLISKSYSKLLLKVRSCLHIEEVLQLLEDNFDEFDRIGRSMILDFLNQMHMPNRSSNSASYIKLNTVLDRFKDLDIYGLTLRLSILQKTRMYYSFRREIDEHSELLKNLSEQILSKLQNSKQVSIYDCYNVMMVFRVQIHERLFDKTLSLIDQLIVNFAEKDTHYDKLQQILFHQLSFVEWSTIRKYPNIIRFFVEKYSIKSSKQNSYIDKLCEMFRKIVDFRFHLVGERKIPSCVKEIIEILQPQIQSISVKNLCALIQSCGQLPARFFPDFKKSLIKQLMKTPNALESDYKVFPFRQLSNDQIKHFLEGSKDVEKILMWNLIYKSTLEEQQAYLRLPVAQIFGQIINKKLIFMESDSKQVEPGQAACRYCILVHHFAKNNNKEIVDKLKKILNFYFQKYGFEDTVQNFALSNYLNLFILFQNEPKLISATKKKLQAILNLRESKSSIYGKKHEYNCLNAIKTHIQSKNELVQEAVDLLIKEMFIKYDPSKPIDPKYEIPLLFEIASVEEREQLKKVKDKLWKKTTIQDIPMLGEYFALYPKKNLRVFQQIFSKMTQMKVSFQEVVIFVSSLSSQILQNHRGRLEYHFVQYLKNYNHSSLKLGLSHLNQLNRFISMLSRHVTINQCLNRVFTENLLEIEKELITPLEKNSLAHNPRLILNYLQKFQQVIRQKELSSPKSHQILNKIFKMLSKLQSLYPTPYVSLKLMEFTFVYRQHLKVSQTIEDIQLESSYNIEKLLQKAKKLDNLGQVLFGVLKLHCFGLDSFENINVVQIVAVIRQAINDNKLNYYQLSEAMKILNYQMKILRTDGKMNEKIGQLILPLLILSQQNTGFLLKFKAYEPLIELATRSYSLKELKPLLMRLLAPGKSKLSPSAMEYLMDCIPMNMITRDFFTLMMQKIIVMINLFDANISRVLYFVEKVFFRWPNEFELQREKIWSAANKILSSKIQELRSRDHSIEETSYLLGRYPLYMHACIKAGRVNENKIFKFLAQVTLSNFQYFLGKIKTNEMLKFLNHSISLYLINCPQYSAYRNKNEKSELLAIKYSPFNVQSHELQSYLKQKKIQYKKMYFLNKTMTVPYYVKDRNEIIFVYKKSQTLSSFFYDDQTLDSKAVDTVKAAPVSQTDQQNTFKQVVKKVPMFKPQQKTLKKNGQLLGLKQANKEQPQPKLDDTDELYFKMNGNVGYLIELCKKIFPGKKIRYWDNARQKLINFQ